MMWHHSNKWQGLAWLLAMLGAVGCSTMGGGISKDSPPEVKQAVVKERVNARWATLIKGDIDASYEFLSATSRENVPLAAYRMRRGEARYTAAAIESIKCEAEACKVELTVTYSYPVQGKIMSGIKTPASETWVLDRGTAWLIYL